MFHGHYRHSSREVLCFECLGDECDACDNLGVITLPEEEEHEFIPYHKRPKNEGMFQSYVWLKQYGSFPNEGPWMNQPARFVRMVEWCDLVNSKWAAYKHERDKAGAKLAQQMGGMFGS